MTRAATRIVAALLVCLATPVAAQVPAPKVFRLAQLASSAVARDLTRAHTLPELARLGYREGDNLVFEERVGEPKAMPDLARELLLTKPDAVLAIGPDAILAAAGATRTTPVITFGSNPVRLGLAASLARPGGNVTGLIILAEELDRKRFGLLLEAAPGLKRVAALLRPSPYRDKVEGDLRATAAASGTDLSIVHVNEPPDYPSAFASIRASGAQALLVTADTVLNRDVGLIAGLALEQGLLTMCEWPENAQAGCLFGYGPSLGGLRRRVAHVIARVLGGASPGDLPIEAPTSLELALNLRTARTLGLDIPRALLARADEVIE